MKLYITDNPELEVSIDSLIMGSSEFNAVQSHPYIRTAGYKVVLIDLTNTQVRFPYIQGVMQFATVVPYYDIDKAQEISETGISVLCELYKDKAAELRYYSFCDPDKFKSLVEDLYLTYNWESFY